MPARDELLALCELAKREDSAARHERFGVACALLSSLGGKVAKLAAELDALRAVAEAARDGIPWLTDDIASLRDSVSRPGDGAIDDDADAGMVAEAEAVLRRIADALAALDKVRAVAR